MRQIGMKMYRNTPVPKNIVAKIYAFIALIGGLVLFLSTNGIDYKYPILPQALAMAFFCFAIYIASVYLLRRYTFSIELSDKQDEDGGIEPIYLFRISELKYAKQMTVCLVEVSDIRLCRTVTPENRKAVNESCKEKKRYRYDTQFAASRQLELQMFVDDEDISMLVTYDADLTAALKSLGVKVE